MVSTDFESFPRAVKTWTDVELRVAGSGRVPCAEPDRTATMRGVSLPIQSPTESHLRFELDRAGSNEVLAPAASGTR